MEDVMARKFVDCREHPSETHCSVALSADNEEELLEAVVQHAKVVHGAQDTPEFRQQIKQSIKVGNPPM
jgi:predicted small metal-binding protein